MKATTYLNCGERYKDIDDHRTTLYIYTTSEVMKLKPEKNAGLNRIQSDTGAVLYQLSYQANWKMVFISSSTMTLEQSKIRNIPLQTSAKNLLSGNLIPTVFKALTQFTSFKKSSL